MKRWTKPRGLTALMFVQLTAWGLGLSAQEKRPMTIVDLIDLPSLSDPQLSPDGTQILYTLAQADWKQNRRIGHIWRIQSDGSSPAQMTGGAKGESSPRWSPDGHWIAFVANRQESSEEQADGGQIFLMSNSGGEGQPLKTHETAVSSIQWSPDGKSIYFLADDPRTDEEERRKEAKDDVISYDEDFKQKHLWRVSVGDRSETRITEGEFSVLGYQLSRDGSMIAHHRAPSPLYDDQDLGEVWLMNTDGSEARRLTDNLVEEHNAECSPDNSTVLFTSDSNQQFETYFSQNIFLVPAQGGSVRMLLPEMPHEVTRASWSADGSSIFFTANTGVRSQLFSVDVTSETLAQLTEGDHSLGNYVYSPPQGKHVFTLDEPENGGDVYLLSSGGSPERVTEVFEEISREFLLPRQELVEWKGTDGVAVEGLLYYPLHYTPGTRYPLCVQTHGGPAASDKFGFGRWNSYIQVLTARGWLVFRPNYRGSTGYGDEFLRDMVGHYYNQAHLDVMAGVEFLIAQGIADEDRLVKMGWSGGGHMTNKIITHTDRFKAASSGAGAINWISMYGQSDVRTYRTPWFGGTPWQQNAPIDVYWEHSPLKDIWKVKTPTIILVGEKDVRVPPPQSIELYRALKTNGVPTHLYVAPREPHGWRELRHELFKVNVELEWFEEHALGRDYTWEKPPD